MGKNPKKEYIMFVDETDPTTTNDYFCLSGLVIERNDYETNIIQKVNQLKIKHFQKSDIVFHYTEIKNNRGDFINFKEATIRNKFYMDLVNLFESLNTTIISTYFNKKHMKNSYGKCAVSDYDVALKYILENFVHFLKEKNGDGMVIMESRVFNQNASLQNTFYNYLKNGSELFTSETIKYHLKCLGFLVKK